ncbi:putative repeat protein (TIGR02059 family), partial [Azospirillum baldaniorum]|uniref:Ig-like domain-containing protein n=1 Tax=Azospirillum baldaniorum TaxID=1064539 RepID=UPI0011A3DB48
MTEVSAVASTSRITTSGRFPRPATEIAVIDTALVGWRDLQAGLPAGMEAVLIGEGRDGVAVTAQALAGRYGIRALHVLCHGFEGGLQLGTARLDQAALAERKAELTAIGACLADDGDILLYGCNVASGHGEAFLDALANLTGASMAASRTPTGAAELGGDWDLAWTRGVVRTETLWIESYMGVLMAAPESVDTVAYVGESTITVTFDGNLDSASQPALSTFDAISPGDMSWGTGAVLINGAKVNVTAAVVSGKTVTLTVSGTLTAGDYIEFRYVDPAGDNSSGVIQATNGLDVASVYIVTTVMGPRPAVPPVLQNATVNGASLVLTYDMALDSANPPTAGAFTVMAGGSPATVSNVVVDGANKTVTLTLAQAVSPTDAVTVAYTDPTSGNDANAVQGTTGVDAATFAAQSVTNNTLDPNGTPPTLTLTPVDSYAQLVMGNPTFDLFNAVGASTVDSGQTFTGMVLTVHYVAGTGSNEFLTIAGTDIALSNGNSGSFTGGNYAVTLVNGVATVAISGMALSNSAMGTLIDGIAYKTTTSTPSSLSQTNFGFSETRPIVLRSITDSGAANNTTEVNKLATASFGMQPGNLSPITITPDNPTATFTVGTPTRLSFTVNISTALTLVGSTLHFDVAAPSGWTIANLQLDGFANNTLTGIIMLGTQTLTFDVTASGADTSGHFPISIFTSTSGLTPFASISAGSVMVTVAPPAPMLQSASVDGTTLVLTYDSALDAANPPAAGAFEVKVGGTTVTVSNVAVNSADKTVTLTLAQAVSDRDTVTVAYTDPTTGDDANAVQSPTGTDAASFTAQPVTNTTPDTTPPTLTSAVLSGTTLTLTYSELLNGAQAPTGAFTVMVGGVARTVTAVASSGKTVTLTLDAGVTSVHQTVTVDYTPPGSGTKTTDAAGNAAGALTGHGVTVPKDPNFVLEGTNPFGLNTTGPWSIPTFADIDGDGDIDALIGMGDGTILFYRNDGSATAPGFTLAGTNPFGLSQLDMNASPTFVDIDGNGTLDALIGDFNGNTVVYRNVGTATAPSFTLVGTNPFGLGSVGTATTPSFVDIDGDGDLDALIGNYDGNTVFFRNIGTATAPSFALESTNPFGLGDAGSYAQPTFVDVDGDGDLDALIGNFAGDMLFYRNVGSATAPSFTLEGTNPFGLENVTFKSVPSIVDIDGDGDLDVLAGGDSIGNKIILFRNLPQPPTNLALTAGTNSGSTTDTLTNATAPAITGQAKALSTVVLYEGATALGTVTADANGLWTITTASLSDGAHSLTAVSTDVTGSSPASSTLTVTIDSGAPNAPAVTSAALSNSATPTLSGTAEAGATVTVTVGGATYVTTATNGAWSLNLATATPTAGSLTLNANGANPVTATATDAAGNTSSAGTQTLTIDTTAPNAPAVTSATLSNNATPILTGTAEAGSTVTVTVGGATYTTTATNGNWSINLATATPTAGSLTLNANGSNAVSATATDAAGNVSTPGTQSLTIDTTAPNAPTVTTALSNSTTPTLTGTAEAGSTVTVTVGGATYTTTATNGTWSVNLATATPTAGSLSLNANGTNPVSATATDAAGNTSAPGTQTLAIDTTAPTAPTVATELSNSTTPTLTGTAEAGSTVTVTVGGATYTTTATNGNWSINLATATPTAGSLSLDANGANPVSATATDAAGNTSAPGTQTLTIDTTAPTAPTVATALTNSTTPTLTGTAETGSTVTVTIGGATYTTTATNGAWSLNLATATPTAGSLSLDANGANPVSATATDAAGNTSSAGTQSLTIDTTLPDAPAVTSAALSNSTTPTLTGTAEAGSTVTVTVGGATYTTTATNGTWSLNLATATPTAGSLSLDANGANPVTATATDAAGNVSTPGTQSLTVDTTLPNAPAVTSAALSNSTTPNLTGTAEAGSTVTVTVGGATYTTTATNGSWSINLATATPTSGLLILNANGANPVTATATDAAGNTSSAGSQTLTIDTTAPTAPTVTSATLSNNATPILTGTAEAGSTVTVTVGGATYTTTATNGGAWTLNLATATPVTGTLSLNANGANPVSATATDAAGNISAPGTQSLTVDTTAPTAPAVTSPALSNSTTPTLTGSAEAGSTVTVTIGGATYTTTATNGTWSLNLATATPVTGMLSLNPNGANPVSATATDAAGNTSSAGSQSLTIDTTLPDAPTVATALSNSTTPTLTGTAEAGSTVTVTVGGATYTTTATNGGNWSINLATATPTAGSLTLNANGTNAVSATATDASGNVSAPGTQSLVIDTTLPDAPTVATALTNSTTPTLTGTAEAGSTVTVTVGGATYTTTATNGGAWSLNLATATPVTGTLSLNANGTNPVSATATDAAGNISAPGTQSLTVDTTPPTASVLFEDDSIDAIEQSSAAFTISGGEAGTSFTWTITSAGGGQVTGGGVMSGPTMRVTGLDLSALGDGTLTLTLGLTDPAGNAAPPFTATTQKLTATVEKPAPVAPPPTATVDGATVNGSVTTGGDGKRVTTVTIAASNSNRVEDTSTANADLADVPVVREQVVDRQTGAVSTVTTLTVSVSTGVAVTTSGSAERQTAAQAQSGLTGLIAAIEARTDAGTASRGNLTGGGDGFLSVLSAQAQLLVRAIDFSTPGVAAGQAVQTRVTGNTLGGTGVASTAPTAVVLNTTAAAGPVTIQLDNVEFAAVVGNATLVGGDG